MDFELNDEQLQLKATLARFLADAGDFAARTRALRAGPGWREDVWQGLARLGVLSIGLPEAQGGFGGGLEMMAAMEEMGRALAPEPLSETLFQAAPLLACGGQTQLLEGVVGGQVRITLAVGEDGMRDDLNAIAMTAARSPSGWQLDGTKCVVVAAPWATHLLVAARTSGSPGESDGLSLFLVPAAAPGVSMAPYRMLDERHAADVSFNAAGVDASALVGGEGQGFALIEEWRDRAIAAAAAEACGVIERLLDDTVAYARQREQFGHKIGSFQALQHRMVDMYLELELARSAALLACQSLDGDPAERAAAASAAKVTVARAVRFAGQNAVQLHGGMGMTDELAIGHYFKRATVIEHQFGSAGWHLARRAALDARAA